MEGMCKKASQVHMGGGLFVRSERRTDLLLLYASCLLLCSNTMNRSYRRVVRSHLGKLVCSK